MADVFVSYASANRERVAPMVAALEAEGWSVWWDRAIAGGEAFDRAIEEAIDQARCIVVVWSAESVESEWVRTEANEGLERGILVPVAIDPVRPPLAFRRSQTLDFSAAPDFDGLTAAVAGHVPREADKTARQAQLVGRDGELATLDSTIQRVAHGAGAMLLISGEAGVGKTRLTREAVAHARDHKLLTLTGHSSEMEGAPPYEPFIEHIEQSVRIIPAEALRLALGENAPEIAKLMPELRALYDDIPESIPLPPDQDRRYLLHGFGEFLERAATAQPMLLVFEDLHWADESTCIMLRHLASRLQRCPVLLLGTYRDTELAPGSPFARILQELVRERLCDDIHLKRLTRQEVAELLEARTNSAPPEQLIDLIFSETEGNAFFVEEVYRNLEESGRLFDSEGNFRAGIEISDTDVPRGVRLVLEQRLERISDNGRKALTTAAVAGRLFSFELLERVADVDVDTLLDVLDEAIAASLVEDVSSRREARYQFAHELIRQTLLASLSLPRRQRLHLRIGDAMSDLADESRVSEVAHHYYQAGAAADPDKTVDYLHRAGERALDALAFEDALRQLDLALEIAQDDAWEIRAQLELVRARALRGSARVEDALAAFESALDHKLPDATYEQLLRERAQLLVDLFRGAEALPGIEELLSRSKARGDETVELEAQLLLAEARYRISLDTPEAQLPAREAAERAIELARAVSNRRALAEALLLSTHFVDYWKDYRPQAQQNLREAKQIGIELDDEDIQIDAETMALRVNIFTPVEWDIAAEEIRERLEARRDPIRLKEHLFWMIMPTRTGGGFERSVEVCQGAIDIAARLGVAPVQYPTFKSYPLMDLGRFDEAWQSIEEEPSDEQYRFGRALQRFGFLAFRAYLGDAESVLADAPALLTEGFALGRAWMTDSLVNLVCRCGSQAGLVEATEAFLQDALAETGSRPNPVERAELSLAKGNAQAAVEEALKAAAYFANNTMPAPRVEAVETAIRALAALERWPEVVEHANDAIDFADGCSFARLQWRLYAHRARAYAALDRAAEAAADRTAGRAIFERIAGTIADPSLKGSYQGQAQASGLFE